MSTVKLLRDSLFFHNEKAGIKVRIPLSLPLMEDSRYDALCYVASSATGFTGWLPSTIPDREAYNKMLEEGGKVLLAN